MNNRNEGPQGQTAEELRELLKTLPDNEIHFIPFVNVREGAEPDAV